MKRIISAILAIVMTIGMMPVGEMVAFAADGDSKLESVEMVRTYKGGILKKLTIRLEGKNLKKAEVVFNTTSGSETKSTSLPPNDQLLVYELEDSKYKSITVMTTDSINTYNIDESELPVITSIDPSNGMINEGEAIILNGERFDKMGSLANVKGYIEGDGPRVLIEYNTTSGDSSKK